MQDILRVDVPQRQRQLAEPNKYLLLRELLPAVLGVLDFPLEIAVLGVLRHDAQVLLVLEGFVVPDDVRVVQRLQDLDLVVERLLGFLRAIFAHIAAAAHALAMLAVLLRACILGLKDEPLVILRRQARPWLLLIFGLGLPVTLRLRCAQLCLFAFLFF